MKSMTGYGRAKQELHGRTITAELRAVNHRYLDCTVKAPRQYGFLDDAVKKAAAARIARGKVEVYIGVETQEGGDIAVTVNHAVAEHYLAALHELADRYGLRDDVSVMSLAKLPDVLGSERIEQDADEMTRDVLSVFGEACDNFDEMRTREGAKLAEDVRNRASEIERMVGEVEVRSPERVREYREKLLARMKEVLADTSIDETRIVTEAAIYADKTAVDEETVRLRSHLQQLDGMLNEVKPVGRKLDFLVQEMNRETNTIGSKANDVSMAQVVVNIKSEIECRRPATAAWSWTAPTADAPAPCSSWTATMWCSAPCSRRPLRLVLRARPRKENQKMRKGTLYVFTGPSGAGKGTVLSRLLSEDEKLFFSISATTRAPRPGEKDGVQYYFLTKEDFEAKIAANAFLEHAKYVDNYYGTLEAPVNEKLEEGCDVILEIEVQGAMQVHEKRPDAVMVFIAPPSFEELANRLRGRGTEDEAKVQKRLETAKGELAQQDKFDYVVVNDTVERAVEELHGILAKRR